MIVLVLFLCFLLVECKRRGEVWSSAENAEYAEGIGCHYLNWR